MKTIIPESYNSNGAVLRCKQHLYILMIENIVPIYRLEYSETPFGSPGKNRSQKRPRIVQGHMLIKVCCFSISPYDPENIQVTKCTVRISPNFSGSADGEIEKQQTLMSIVGSLLAKLHVLYLVLKIHGFKLT